MEIVIRVDSSSKMGIGHIMRCLTLADEIKQNGVFVKFISRKHPGNINNLISKRGFQVFELQTPRSKKKEKNNSHLQYEDYSEWLGVSEMEDSNDTILALNNCEPEWLIVDHYALGEIWEKQLRSHVKKIFVIDDIANRLHDCDILLDQNWFENMEARYEDLVPAGCTQLLGPKYVLLRPEFSIAKKNIKPRIDKVKRIFISFGGTDPDNLTKTTLRALSDNSFKDLNLDIVIGESYPHTKELIEIAEERGNARVHLQIDNIATIMVKSDLAIGSGGVSTWEKMALLLMGLTIATSDNQKLIMEPLAREKGLLLISDKNKVNIKVIQEYLLKLIDKPNYLTNQRKLLKNFINVEGTKLVIEWLAGSLVNVKWEARKATINDMRLYWAWANDKMVRQNAINKKYIDWENHINWFEDKLIDNNCSLYLVLANGFPIGQVRFEHEGTRIRIDYSIARQFRGRKMGKKILGKAINEFHKNNNNMIIFGEVLPDNIASAKTFSSLGFSMDTKEGIKIFSKKLSMQN